MELDDKAVGNRAKIRCNLKQPNFYLFSTTLKNDIVTTTQHKNKILDKHSLEFLMLKRKLCAFIIIFIKAKYNKNKILTKTI